MHLDAVAVSGANEYKVNPRALVTTLTPLTVTVLSAAPDPAAPDAEAEAPVGVPLPAPVPDDELEHAAAPSATATIPAAATIVIRIDLSISAVLSADSEVGQWFLLAVLAASCRTLLLFPVPGPAGRGLSTGDCHAGRIVLVSATAQCK